MSPEFTDAITAFEAAATAAVEEAQRVSAGDLPRPYGRLNTSRTALAKAYDVMALEAAIERHVPKPHEQLALLDRDGRPAVTE